MFSRYNKSGSEVWVTKEKHHRTKIHRTLCCARTRAADCGVPFDIDLDYLCSIFPSDNRCPVFGIDLVWGDDTGRSSSPSLDRIHPAAGYVKGNVIWVSNYANIMKSNHSISSLERLVNFYKKIEKQE